MKSTKKLSLRRDSIHVLAQHELGAVAAGQRPDTRVRNGCAETYWPPCPSDNSCFSCPIFA